MAKCNPTCQGASVDAILDQFPGAGRDALIPILQRVQQAEGHLSRASVVSISRRLGLPASKIYGVATFYNQFRFQAQGAHHIQVCRGTACHVKGSGRVLEALRQELSIDDGDTSDDGLFSLEVVACIGACGLAPVIAVNGAFHAKVDPDDVPGLIQSYRAQSAQEVAS